jgi:hypothetical protein
VYVSDRVGVGGGVIVEVTLGVSVGGGVIVSVCVCEVDDVTVPDGDNVLVAVGGGVTVAVTD